MTTNPIPRQELLRDQPAATTLTAEAVREARGTTAHRLVVLDDDPTGTQSVGDLPVLTGWTEADLTWALETGAPAVYVMTNSRSLAPDTAAERNREVAVNALRAAALLGIDIDFVSRSDSTLRGHYPLEPDVLRDVLAGEGIQIDGVIIVPAFGDAGRITVDGVHYAGSDKDGFVPVGDTEFAKDASFGFRSSDLRAWVEEKSDGRYPRSEVPLVSLRELRIDHEAVVATLTGLTDGQPVVVDIVEESDLRELSLAVLAAERAGKRFLHRVGPPFVRALIGQDILAPLDADEVARIRTGGLGEDATAGIIAIGSHVTMTTRQLGVLRERRQPAELEIDVSLVLGPERDEHLSDLVNQAVQSMEQGNVVVRTSRTLVTGNDPEDSLRIARNVSDALVEVIQRILASSPPRFVVAKGGITSSDVASRGLGITRAIVRGPMLPGIVSLWEPSEGPARGIPYIVFAGNVGDDQALADVVDKLTL